MLALPAGWSLHQHPEGSAYFEFHSSSPPMRVVTRANPSTHVSTTHWVSATIRMLQAKHIDLPDTVEICLPLYSSNSNDYYFVHHGNRQVFLCDVPKTGWSPPPPASSCGMPHFDGALHVGSNDISHQTSTSRPHIGPTLQASLPITPPGPFSFPPAVTGAPPPRNFSRPR